MSKVIKGKRHWVKNQCVDGRSPEYPDCPYADKDVIIWVRCEHPDRGMCIEYCSTLHMKFGKDLGTYRCPLSKK